MKKLFLTGLAILGLGFVTVPMSAKAQTTASPTPSGSAMDNGSMMNKPNSTMDNGSMMNKPNSTMNDGSSMKKPNSAAKSPRSTLRPRHIVNSSRSHGGGTK